MGAFFALTIGMSGVNFFNIGAPLWAISGSLLVSFLVEKSHFAARVKPEKEKEESVPEEKANQTKKASVETTA